MTVVFDDEDTNHEIACFFNPRINRYTCFLRDRVTFRFIRFLREFYVCATCTFHTSPKGKHWSKGLYVESQSCTVLSYSDFAFCTSDEEFVELVRAAEEEAGKGCGVCFAMFGVDYEVAGITFHSEFSEEYCRKLHPIEGYLIKEYGG